MTTHGSTRPGRSALPAYLARAAALALLLVLLLRPAWLQGLFAPFADNGAPVIYDRASLLDLTLAHLGTVALSSVIGTIVAVAAGIAVTRPWGADFLPVARSVVDIGQTFPPVAVLALAVPAVGFGLKPVLIALVLYGLLPVFESTIAGPRTCRATSSTPRAGWG